MSEWLSQFFKDLSDGQKMAVVWVLILLTAGQLAWSLYAYLSSGRVRRENKLLRKEKKELASEVRHLEQRLEALNHVDHHVWLRPLPPNAPPMVGKELRVARFIAVCNLKGGVGKTTTTLNLGAVLAAQGKRVLFVDLDFQGTLSNSLLPDEQLKEYRHKGWTSEALLREDAEADAAAKFAFPASGVANARVIISGDTLEIEEFRQQAKTFVNPAVETRLALRRRLQTPELLADFDFVLFDCPPRMSTACINALMCSDYLLIPTSLSQLDIEAVPRTMKWLSELKQVIPTELAGILIAKCRIRGGKLTTHDQGQLGSLKAIVDKFGPARTLLFAAVVPDHLAIYKSASERRPVVIDSDDMRGYYEKAAKELLGRIR